MTAGAAVQLTVVLAYVVGAVALSWVYFRTVEIERPPIGTINGRDVVFMSTTIMATPLLYLALPVAAVAVFMTVVVSTILFFLLSPLLRRTALVWAAVATLVGTDIALSRLFDVSNPFLVHNNLVLALIAVGFANSVAQSGLRATHLAFLAGFLTVYDFVTVTQVSLMADLVGRVGRLPFGPFVTWRADGFGLGIGLGDVIVLCLAPLVLRKAFGVRAGAVAAAVSVVAAAAILAGLAAGTNGAAVPVLLVYGPIVILQVVAWRLARGGERTTREYLEVEPRRFLISADSQLALERR